MPGTRPAPDLPPGRRSALVVGTGTYDLPRLAALRSPARDAADLAAVLGAPEIGGFQVTVLTDPVVHDLRLGIEEFLTTRSVEETVVVYLSCHGVLSKRRKLFFAARDTNLDRLGSTALEAPWLLEQLDECPARRQVVLLDCCFSGAFARTKTGLGPQDVGLEEQFGVREGRGRTVLTASRATEYSFEGEELPDGSNAASVFTEALVEGLGTGAADIDRDGLISVTDAYNYVYRRVVARGEAQTPQQWTYGGEGNVTTLARSAAGVDEPDTAAPARADEDIVGLLEYESSRVRLAAVEDLGDRLASGDPERVRRAREALRRVAEQDDPAMAELAWALLRRHSPIAKVEELLDEADRLLTQEIPPYMQAPFLVSMARTVPATDPRRRTLLIRALHRIETNSLAADIDRQRAAVAEAFVDTDPSRAEELTRAIEDDPFLKARTLVKISAALKDDVVRSGTLFRKALVLIPELEDTQRARLWIDIAAAYPDVESYRESARKIPWPAGRPQEEIRLLIDAAALFPATDPGRRELLERAEALNSGTPPWLPDLAAGWAPVDRDRAERLALAMTDGLTKVRVILTIASNTPPGDPRRALLSADAEKIARALPLPEVRVTALAEAAATLPPKERFDLLTDLEDTVSEMPEAGRVPALAALARAWSEVEEP